MESAVAVPASIGRKFAASLGTSGTNCQARNAPTIPASKLTSTLSKTKSRSTLPRDAPSAMRNEISRRRPLNLTSSRLATLLHAMSKTKRHRREQRGETRPQIFRHIFRQRLDAVHDFASIFSGYCAR